VISLERRHGRPLRIGHRGAAALAPENTIRSFRAAVEAGVDLVELDVLALDGGELVVAHSYDLYEVSHHGVRGTLRGRTLDDLRADCPELPALDEALAFFADDAAGVGVHADLKSPAAALALGGALARFGLVERAVVSSTHFGALRELAGAGPGVRTALTFPRTVGISEDGRLAPAVRAGLAGLRAAVPALAGPLLRSARASVLSLHCSVVSAAAVHAAHRRGAAVIAWTVDDADELARVEAAGVDAVVTNDPAIFASTLQP
jgi:glycerophosphoryl diester phosphodiesterase